jgi:hypothetical protein
MSRKKKNAIKPAIRCAKDLASVPFQVFRLPSDGERKWQAVCMRRRAVLQQLALAANQNGKSICLGADRIAADTGFGRATVFRILQDLRALGFLTDDGKTHPKYHTRVRAIDVPRVKAAKPSQIKPAKPPSQIKAPCTKRAGRDEQPSQINFRPSQINEEPSQMYPDPTEDLTEEHTAERIEDPAPNTQQNEPSQINENEPDDDYLFLPSPEEPSEPSPEEELPELPKHPSWCLCSGCRAERKRATLRFNAIWHDAEQKAAAEAWAMSRNAEQVSA